MQGWMEGVVAIVAIGCATGLLATLIQAIQGIATQRGSGTDQRVLQELEALRDEVRQLRQLNHDLLLSLDTHVDRFTSRSVVSETSPSTRASESQALGRDR